MLYSNSSTNYLSNKASLFIQDQVYIRRYNITLINVDFILKEIIASRLFSKDIIKSFEYFELLKYRYVYYLFFVEIKANVN